MKKFLLFGLMAAPAYMMAQVTLISENFDGYTSGNTIVAEGGGVWDTWTGGAGTAEDPSVSSTQSNSPSNSVNVFNTGAGAYLHDLVLPFASTYTTGQYQLNMNIYVTAGNGGYFNLGGAWTTGGTGYEYGIDVFFNSDGSGNVTGDMGVFTYTLDSWTAVSCLVDLTAGTVDVSINGTSVYNGAWGAPSGFGVVDIFGVAYDGVAGTEITSNFFVDDVELIEEPFASVENQDFSASMSVLPNPNNGQFAMNFNTVESGVYTMNVLDVLGNIVYTENLTISNGSTFNFDLDLADGLYFINVNNTSNSATRKIIVR